MSDQVASLGFEVDSKSLDEAKKKLGEVSTEAGKTGKAVDDFNQKVGKTGAEATKAADGVGKVTPALSAVEAAAKRAGTSVEDMQKKTAAFNKETDALTKGAASAGTAIGTVAKEAAAVSPALNAVAAASASAAREKNALSASATSLRGTLNGLNAVVGQFGGNLGALTQAAGASRLGILGLAAAAGTGLAVAIAKTADEVERTKNRLSGLTGSNEAGARSYDALKAAAQASGTELSALERAVEGAKIGQEQFASKMVIYANTAEQAAKQTREIGSAFSVVGGIMRGNLATADEVNKAYETLGKTFETTGKFTADSLKTIRDLSPSTATALANAFGYKTVADFNKELERAPITLEDFVRRMALVKPKVDELFDPSKPKTYGQAIEDVGKEWTKFLQSLTDVGVFEVVKDGLAGVGGAIKALPDIVKQEVEDFKALSGAVSTAASSVGNVLAIIGRLPTEGIASITSFVDGAITQFGRLANAAISAAQTAAKALSSIAAGGGGAAGSGGPALSGGGNAGSTDAMGSVMGGTGGSSDTGSSVDYGTSSSGFDPAQVDYGGGSSDYGYFASGGQFTVGGSGGTDSQTVSFKATPGETVTVTTPEDAATGAVNIQGLPITSSPATASVKEITDAIGESTIDITKKIVESSENIVSALKGVAGGSGSTVNPSTGLSVSSAASGGRSVLDSLSGTSRGAGGGGGFNTRPSQGPSEEFKKAIAAQNSGGGPVSDPMYGTAYGATSFYRGNFATFGPPAGQFVGSGSSVEGPNDFYGSDYTFSSTGETPYGNNSAGSNYYSDYGGSTDTGIIGFDPGAMDYGGGSSDYGYFADGGQFTVKGSGGTDSQRVSFMATPGEDVTVSTPSSMASPVPSNMPTLQDPSVANTSVTKNVTINVMPGIQAESFIKSRAQIARSL